jgi:hypothetical protein
LGILRETLVHSPLVSFAQLAEGDVAAPKPAVELKAAYAETYSKGNLRLPSRGFARVLASLGQEYVRGLGIKLLDSSNSDHFGLN